MPGMVVSFADFVKTASTIPAVSNPIPYFNPAQLSEIELARQRYRPIRRAITSATFFGWSVAAFGGLSLICNVFSFGWSGVFVGLGLCLIGYVELTHVAKLKQLDPEAARVLGYNQFALAGLLTAYALWELLFPAPIPPEVAAQLEEVKSVMDVEALQRSIRVMTYTTLIAVALLVEGSLAFFYFRRTRMVKDFLAETPEWILAMQKSGMGL